MKHIVELGPVIDREWRKHDYDDIAFPELAREALQASHAWSETSVDDIVRWFVSSGGADAPQFLDGFGQPNLRVYSNHKFRVELLFWFEGTTSIHQHGFSGAFGVVNGSSLHTSFRFDRSRRITRDLEIGNLHFLASEVLERGAVRMIHPGPDHIHSLYHLDYPSVSMVVRTHEDLRHQPQMRYSRPGLAEAGQYDPYPHKSVLALLEAACRLGTTYIERYALQVIAEYDILNAFRAARLVLSRRDIDEAATTAVRNAFGRRDQELCDVLTQVIENDQRERAFLEKRRQITKSDHRFMLALLLNVPDRRTILSLLSKRYAASEPARKAASLLIEMSSTLGVPIDARASTLLETAIGSASEEEFVARTADQGNWSAEARRRVWTVFASSPAIAPLFT